MAWSVRGHTNGSKLAYSVWRWGVCPCKELKWMTCAVYNQRIWRMMRSLTGNKGRSPNRSENENGMDWSDCQTFSLREICGDIKRCSTNISDPESQRCRSVGALSSCAAQSTIFSIVASRLSPVWQNRAVKNSIPAPKSTDLRARVEIETSTFPRAGTEGFLQPLWISPGGGGLRRARPSVRITSLD
jgi:hypothetical protein